MKSAHETIEAVIEELRPYIQSDGGDVEFLGIEDQRVRVRMTGACATCRSLTKFGRSIPTGSR